MEIHCSVEPFGRDKFTFLNVKNVLWRLSHLSTCSLCSVWICSLFLFDVLKCSSQYGHFVEIWQVLTWRSKLSFLFIFSLQNWHSLSLDPMWTLFSCRFLTVLNSNCFLQKSTLEWIKCHECQAEVWKYNCTYKGYIYCRRTLLHDVQIHTKSAVKKKSAEFRALITI